MADLNYMGVTVAVTVLLMVITLTITIQHNSIKQAASFSKENIGYSMKASATTLHIWNKGGSLGYGKFEREEFDYIVSDCGEKVDFGEISTDSEAYEYKMLNSIDIGHCVDFDLEGTGLLTAVRVEENGEESVESLVVG